MEVNQNKVEETIESRRANYGHPFDDFSRAMGMLSALGYRFQDASGEIRPLTAEDQPIIMMCVKISREVNRHNPDNTLDIPGYSRCLEMVVEKRREITAKPTWVPVSLNR